MTALWPDYDYGHSLAAFAAYGAINKVTVLWLTEVLGAWLSGECNCKVG